MRTSCDIKLIEALQEILGIKNNVHNNIRNMSKMYSAFIFYSEEKHKYILLQKCLLFQSVLYDICTYILEYHILTNSFPRIFVIFSFLVYPTAFLYQKCQNVRIMKSIYVIEILRGSCLPFNDVI